MDVCLHFVVGFFIRLVFVYYGSWHDNFFKVKYTDIDYQVFLDAAEYIWNGGSPFERHTYRYTPFLAIALIPSVAISNLIGKIFFSMLDIVTSVLIYKIQKKYNYPDYVCRYCTFFWLYNPMSIVISTRGNAESIMTVLVILCIYCYTCRHVMMLGIALGLATHFKIYPCIYAITFYFGLTKFSKPISSWEKCTLLLVPSKEKIIFVLSCAVGFGAPTLMAFYMYTYDYLQNAFLYHLVRKDIRHNFSPYFYLLYLSESLEGRFGFLSQISFLFQIILILFMAVSFSDSPTLPVCMFLQTFAFVSFNKVCTSQYFMWYLCLLPVSYPAIKLGKGTALGLVALWLYGQGIWLLSAFLLEFSGRNTFMLLFLTSLQFFVINVYLLSKFLKCIDLKIMITRKTVKKSK